MSGIEAIRTYLRTCPLLEDEKINVDFLGEKAGSYTVDIVPSKETVTKYVDGSSRRQLEFVIASRADWGEEFRQNVENIDFFEQLSAWLETQSNAGSLPVLDAGKTAQKVEALTGGYALEAETNTARYQIQCRLIYYQEA